MGIAKNVAGAEKTGRIVLGMILVPVGFFLSGLWQLLFIFAGVGSLLSGLLGY
jgi:predicted phage tail protein